jgi:hypothetical protein
MPGKKRAAKDEDDSDKSPPKKNKSDTDYSDVDFGSEAKTKSDEKWNLKITSW